MRQATFLLVTCVCATTACSSGPKERENAHGATRGPAEIEIGFEPLAEGTSALVTYRRRHESNMSTTVLPGHTDRGRDHARYRFTRMAATPTRAYPMRVEVLEYVSMDTADPSRMWDRSARSEADTFRGKRFELYSDGEEIIDGGLSELGGGGGSISSQIRSLYREFVDEDTALHQFLTTRTFVSGRRIVPSRQLVLGTAFSLSSRSKIFDTTSFDQIDTQGSRIVLREVVSRGERRTALFDIELVGNFEDEHTRTELSSRIRLAVDVSSGQLQDYSAEERAHFYRSVEKGVDPRLMDIEMEWTSRYDFQYEPTATRSF